MHDILYFQFLPDYEEEHLYLNIACMQSQEQLNGLFIGITIIKAFSIDKMFVGLDVENTFHWDMFLHLR